VGITITSGPGTLAPGQSAQYTASARLSDGTVQTAAEAGVRWVSQNETMLRIDASGLVTALEKLGDTAVFAFVGNPAVGNEFRTAKPITVVPEGTYRLVGEVTEAESPSLGIPGARVEVTPGGLVTSTDGGGTYKLYGVPPDAHIRVTAEGYLPHERSVRLTGHATEDVSLTLSGQRLTIDGPYTLAIDAVNACSNVTVASQHRSYEAVVTQTGPEVSVALTEPRFKVNEIGRGNRFAGRVVGAVAEFTLDTFNPDVYRNFGATSYPNVAERLPDGRFLVVSGTAVVTASGRSLSGNFNGAFSEWSSGFPTNLQLLATCGSPTHRFTLTPR